MRKGDDIDHGSTKLKKNYYFMEKEGSIYMAEHVKFMILSNNYNTKDCEP